MAGLFSALHAMARVGRGEGARDLETDLTAKAGTLHGVVLRNVIGACIAREKSQ